MTALGGACDGKADGSGDTQRVSAVVSTASLQLKVLTNTCGANQMQDFFQVVNTGSAAVKLSDIKIKLWADDTSGQAIAPHVSTGGCASGANGSPSCVHQVTGVTTAAKSFSPACGPDATHQANWEITLSSTDSALLPAGATWNNIQTSVNLANFANFKPGTGAWFSPCLSGSAYVADPHFALYYKDTLVFSNGIPAPDCRAPHGTQPITSYVQPPASPVIGPAPASQVLSVAVGLPVTNLAQLRQFADQVSDPASPNYRKYMTSTDVIATYSPSVASYNQVVSWAQGRGFLKVGTFPNRLLVSVTGTVTQIEAAFHANVILAKRPDGSTFYRLDRQPSVDLAVPLLGVSGLDDYVRLRRGGATSPLAGQFGPKDFQKAYLAGAACTGLDGAGQKIGIYATIGGFDQKDIDLYRSRSGLPAGTVQVLNGDDPNNPSPTPLAVTGNGETVELELDLEAAGAMAPAAQIVAVQGSNLDGILQTVANHPDILQFSSSWMVGTTAMLPTTLAVMAAQGQTFVECSGDASAYLQPGTTTPTCSAADLAAGNITQLEYVPADFRSMPYVTVVGGTSLTTDAAQNYSGESAWGGPMTGGWGSGGGVLTGTPIPPYQVNANAGNADVSKTFRSVPDVALPGTNVYVVLSTCTAAGHGGITGQTDPGTKMPIPAACPMGSLTSGLETGIGGTSAATPLWAGVVALMNQKAAAAGGRPVGFLNPALYAIGKDPARYASAFHDVSVGNVVNNCGLGLQTTAGYDLTTGWGTPQCGAISAIIGATPVVTAGVSTVAQGGALICLTGKQFTPGGTVTIDYLGVPELAGTANPVQTVTSTLQVAADGTFFESDNEIQTIAGYVAAGAAGCPANGVGTVSVRVTDNSTGAIGTTTLPTRVFCRANLSNPFEVGAGCWVPPATRPLFVSAGGLPPELASYGPVVCVSGLGLTPGGAVDVEFDDVPLPGYTPQHYTATADAAGKVLINDSSNFSVQGDGVLCTAAQASSRVTVILTDKATGNTAKNTLDAELWCSINFNPPASGDLSGCGL